MVYGFDHKNAVCLIIGLDKISNYFVVQSTAFYIMELLIFVVGGGVVVHAATRVTLLIHFVGSC